MSFSFLLVSLSLPSTAGASVSAHLRVLDIAKNNINHRVQLDSAAASLFLTLSTRFLALGVNDSALSSRQPTARPHRPLSNRLHHNNTLSLDRSLHVGR